MKTEIAEQLLDELGTSLENLEAQNAALLQLLKDKGIVTDDEISPYFTQAAKASNVRWRAARVRLESLFAAEKRETEQRAEKEHPPAMGAQNSAPKQEAATESENNKGGSEAGTRKAGDSVAASASENAQSASEKDGKQNAAPVGESSKASA